MRDERTAGVDEALVQALRGLGRRGDPEPGDLAVAAVAAYRWRTADATPATLSYDSLLDDTGLAGAPGPAPGRRLTFESGELTVEVEVGDDRDLAGRLAPAGAAEVELRGPGGSCAATAGADGRFTVPVSPPGPLSLRIQDGPPSRRRAVVTDWFTL